jgi:hypothetical protein
MAMAQHSPFTAGSAIPPGLTDVIEVIVTRRAETHRNLAKNDVHGTALVIEEAPAAAYSSRLISILAVSSLRSDNVHPRQEFGSESKHNF